MMNIVRCETIDQLKFLIKKALFRDHNEVMGEQDVRLTPVEVCEVLGINHESLLEDRGDTPDPDIFEEGVLAMLEVEQFVLGFNGIAMLQDFRPGVLVFHFEDSHDKVGEQVHHTFHYVANSDMTFDHWLEWYNAIQTAYAERNSGRVALNKLNWD